MDPVLESLSRTQLATLGREWLLIGHLQDRVGLPLVLQRFGSEAMVQLSIDEWMCASPIYSRRMQRALGFEGSDVATAFKNFQLDIGAPHQFMDFQFRLDSAREGEFWLPHCGALLDVEPFGEERVIAMCHTIEDPTFDATAAATHPQMVVRPIHRPPRQPADRVPHCRWRVYIDDAAVPPDPHPLEAALARSRIAGLELEPPSDVGERGGWSDYSGAFRADFQLEDLSCRALRTALAEFAVQTHLLARAFLTCLAERHGEDAALEIAQRQWAGIAGLGAERLHRALRIEGGNAAEIAQVFRLHPHFHPREYVDLRVTLAATGIVHLALHDCPALHEADGLGWFAGLGPAAHPALDAIAAAVHPQARCVPVDPTSGAVLAWDVTIDPDAAPHDPGIEGKLARLSRGASFDLKPRRRLPS